MGSSTLEIETENIAAAWAAAHQDPRAKLRIENVANAGAFYILQISRLHFLSVRDL